LLVHESVALTYHCISWQVQEKQEARETYDDAIASGHTGLLLEQENMLDVFTCRIGNLPSATDATIQLVYVMQASIERDDLVESPREAHLKVESFYDEQVEEERERGEDFSLRLTIPSAVAPRYTPRDQDNSSQAVSLAQVGVGPIAVGTPGTELLRITGDVTSTTGYCMRSVKACL